MAKETDAFTKYLWYTILVFSFADFIVSCAVAAAQVNDGGYRGNQSTDSSNVSIY